MAAGPDASFVPPVDPVAEPTAPIAEAAPTAPEPQGFFPSDEAYEPNQSAAATPSSVASLGLNDTDPYIPSVPVAENHWPSDESLESEDGPVNDQSSHDTDRFNQETQTTEAATQLIKGDIGQDEATAFPVADGVSHRTNADETLNQEATSNEATSNEPTSSPTQLPADGMSHWSNEDETSNQHESSSDSQDYRPSWLKDELANEENLEGPRDEPPSSDIQNDLPEDVDSFDSVPPQEEEELEFAAPAPGAPVSTLDVLKRMGSDFQMEDDAQTADDSDQPQQPENRLATALGLDQEEPEAPEAATPSWQNEAAEPAAEEHQDDESIENYMSRLMERVRGGQPEPPVAPVSSPAPPSPAQAFEQPASESTVNNQNQQIIDDAQPPTDPASMAPRTAAPEKDHDWQAMRELANHSARNAIVISEHKRWSSRALGKTVVMFLLIILGFMLHILSSSYVSAVFLCSLACYALAVYFFLQIGQIMKQVSTIQKAKAETANAETSQQSQQQRQQQSPSEVGQHLVAQLQPVQEEAAGRPQ